MGQTVGRIILGKMARRAIGVVGLGVGIVAGIVAYVLFREQEAQSAEHENAITPRPEHQITIKPEQQRSIEPAGISLILTAQPAKFIRRQSGSITAETLPGATCSIEAVYSTNRRPSGLEITPVKADDNGKCSWTWEIGTGGSHVDVTVKASAQGQNPIETTLRVEIVDS